MMRFIATILRLLGRHPPTPPLIPQPVSPIAVKLLEAALRPSIRKPMSDKVLPHILARQLMDRYKTRSPEAATAINDMVNEMRRRGQGTKTIEYMNERMAAISVYHPEVYDDAVKQAISKALPEFNITWAGDTLSDEGGEFGMGGDWWKT